MEREITLRDYARVLWSGRWVLLATVVACALIAAIVNLSRETTYTAESIVYMGLATTAGTGTPVSTPLTTPITAQKTIRGDRFVDAAATAVGVDPERVRDGITPTVDRIPGAAGGNQPVVATLRYSDTDPKTAIRVVNAYAQAVYDFTFEKYDGVLSGYRKLVDDGRARIVRIQRDLDRERAKGSGADATLLASLQQELSYVQLSVDENAVKLAKTEQIETPYIFTEAKSASSDATSLLRSIVFGAIVGLILGAIAVFIWKGSPARGAAS